MTTEADTATTAWWFPDTLVVQHRMAGTGFPVLLETTAPVGASPPLHVHLDGDDSWYVLDGQLSVYADDGFLRLVQTLGVPAEPGRPPAPCGGPGLEELTRIMAAHDITVVGPSMEQSEADALVAAS